MHVKIENNFFKMAASVPFKNVFKEVTRLTQKSNNTLVTRKATKEMKLLSQLSTASQNAVTWGRILHLLNMVKKIFKRSLRITCLRERLFFSILCESSLRTQKQS